MHYPFVVRLNPVRLSEQQTVCDGVKEPLYFVLRRDHIAGIVQPVPVAVAFPSLLFGDDPASQLVLRLGENRHNLPGRFLDSISYRQ